MNQTYENRMKVTYIHHSSVCVEVEGKVLVFDYYDGKSVESCPYHGKMPVFPEDTELYVFSSHSHRDHFDREVLEWSRRYDRIHYIFAKEVKRKLGNSVLKRVLPKESVKENICYVKPAEKLEIAGVQIETLLSTDSGVAFLVTCGEKTIYHAGDLNWWCWEGETEKVNRYQEETYKAQIDLLADRRIDLAFVVMDPRQEQDMYLGMDYFISHVEAEHIIPVHMWKKYHYIGKYKERLKDPKQKDRIAEVTGENQEFVI